MTKDQYIELIKNLMPPGWAWPRELGTAFHDLATAMAEEFYRFDRRASVNLIDEFDPNTTTELLSEWERVLGLPDPCAGTSGGTLAERRAQVLKRVIARGGQSPAFYIELAEKLGYTVTVTKKFYPFRVGAACAGDALTNGDWIHAWQINAASNTVSYFRVGQNAVGDPLANWGNEVLECSIEAEAPAHSIVIFAYS